LFIENEIIVPDGKSEANIFIIVIELVVFEPEQLS
jgi:hypothetical protein